MWTIVREGEEDERRAAGGSNWDHGGANAKPDSPMTDTRSHIPNSTLPISPGYVHLFLHLMNHITHNLRP